MFYEYRTTRIVSRLRLVQALSVQRAAFPVGLLVSSVEVINLLHGDSALSGNLALEQLVKGYKEA